MNDNDDVSQQKYYILRTDFNVCSKIKRKIKTKKIIKKEILNSGKWSIYNTYMYLMTSTSACAIYENYTSQIAI